MNKRNHAFSVLLIFLAASSLWALAYDPTVEVREAWEVQSDAIEEMPVYTPHAIFVVASNLPGAAGGVAEEIRKDTLRVTSEGRLNHVLEFTTVSGKVIQVPFFTLQPAERALNGILSGDSIDLSACERDVTLFEGGKYDPALGCVVGYWWKQRGYFCQRTDRTPLVPGFSPESYAKTLPMAAFRGPEREVERDQCLRHGGNVR